MASISLESYEILWSWSLIFRFIDCGFCKIVTLDVFFCIIHTLILWNQSKFDPSPYMRFQTLEKLEYVHEKISELRKWGDQVPTCGLCVHTIRQEQKQNNYMIMAVKIQNEILIRI